ncbi:DUF1232 domain-containing protein [Sorangium sp. So ce1036]|uniref:YkvA family protein n=1 Tax=Sorangium sp. So ce1036 TaxID=3133328 RepID=UPI003F0B22F8
MEQLPCRAELTITLARRAERRDFMISQRFDARSFMTIVSRYAKKVRLISDALALYVCMVDEATPIAVKAIIAAALGYFIIPTDALADWIPVHGLIDDGTVLTITLGMVQAHVTDEHRRRARAWLAG